MESANNPGFGRPDTAAAELKPDTVGEMAVDNSRDPIGIVLEISGSGSAMPEGARSFLDAIPALRNRECIICGEGVSIPIRMTFDELEEAKRPASADPSFSDLWRHSGGEEGMVERTVQRWRAQGR